MITSEPLENEECSRETLGLPVFKGSRVLLLRLPVPVAKRRRHAGPWMPRDGRSLSCSSAATRQSAFTLPTPELLFPSLTGTDAGHAGDGGVNRLQRFPPEPTLSFVKTPPVTVPSPLFSQHYLVSAPFRGSVASAGFPAARPDHIYRVVRVSPTASPKSRLNDGVIPPANNPVVLKVPALESAVRPKSPLCCFPEA